MLLLGNCFVTNSGVMSKQCHRRVAAAGCKWALNLLFILFQSGLRNSSQVANYRPHPKDGEGTVFTEGRVPHLHPIILPPSGSMSSLGEGNPPPSHNTSIGPRFFFRGVPQPRQVLGQDSGYPGTGWGTLPFRTGLGIPCPGLGGVPPPHPGLDGVPPPPPNWDSMACTCYAAGDMPLAFTQEEFLIFLCCSCVQCPIADIFQSMSRNYLCPCRYF